MKNISYLKTSQPYPIIAAKIRGAKSRAGLMGYPRFIPNAIPSIAISNPMRIGWMLSGISIRLSVITHTNSAKNPVPTNWKKRNDKIEWNEKLTKLFHLIYISFKLNLILFNNKQIFAMKS